MRKIIVISILIFLLGSINAQDQQNSADRLLETEGRLKIGGYGEVHLNREISSERNSKVFGLNTTNYKSRGNALVRKIVYANLSTLTKLVSVNRA